MTREEAIEALNEIFDDSEFSRYEAWYGTAMDMAIESLSADTVSREVYDTRTQADEKIIDSYRQEFQKALSAEAVQEWIPVSERLPENNGQYLCTLKSQFRNKRLILQLYYGVPCMPMNGEDDKMEWYETTRDGDFFWDDVIAWMPLPEPYKGGK